MRGIKRISGRPEDMVLMDLPEPQIPRDDWIKIKVAYAGICGSDIKMFRRDCSGLDSKLKPPVIPGHESSGIVWEKGSAVTNIEVGDRVIYHTMVDNCGTCEYCLTGNWGLCSSRKGIGSDLNGAFAEYLVCPAKNAIRIPEEVSLRTAALTEPLACSVRIVEEIGEIRRGEKAVIFGPGPIGACCAVLAKANGAVPVVVGTRHSRHRMNVLKENGIQCFINDENLLENIDNFFGGPADLAVDAVGNEKVFLKALDIVKKLGRVIAGAVDESGKGYAVPMDEVFRRQIKILPSCSSAPKDWHKALTLLWEYHDEFESFISAQYPLEEWKEAFQKAESREGFKIMLKP
ncbi:zinc-dependent alcohol dehydrogenase [Anaerostipes sp.]|uniref:zinc-dependent alcohol dehydrogenase n=1 Tax=Anaerostipes sp. TaxID=1872530 RepID=UPI0025BE9E55|nr:alcohol dehydrogenase catalytic domain-containing protein [Anaerostipes sp.]MBS7009597.1 alcohol dehydrogenase catalytic domain-containing protein [Anaerostipes sp.]